MTARSAPDQIAFRYRARDSEGGVTRATVKRLAEQLGVDETQVIHRALRELAVRLLPQYEADDGPLSDEQMREIDKAAGSLRPRSVRSSLFEEATAERGEPVVE